MLVAFARVFSAFYTLLLSWTVRIEIQKKIEHTYTSFSCATISQWLRIVRYLVIIAIGLSSSGFSVLNFCFFFHCWCHHAVRFIGGWVHFLFRSTIFFPVILLLVLFCWSYFDCTSFLLTGIKLLHWTNFAFANKKKQQQKFEHKYLCDRFMIFFSFIDGGDSGFCANFHGKIRKLLLINFAVRGILIVLFPFVYPCDE